VGTVGGVAGFGRTPVPVPAVKYAAPRRDRGAILGHVVGTTSPGGELLARRISRACGHRWGLLFLGFMRTSSCSAVKYAALRRAARFGAHQFLFPSEARALWHRWGCCSSVSLTSSCSRRVRCTAEDCRNAYISHPLWESLGALWAAFRPAACWRWRPAVSVVRSRQPQIAHPRLTRCSSCTVTACPESCSRRISPRPVALSGLLFPRLALTSASVLRSMLPWRTVRTLHQAESWLCGQHSGACCSLALAPTS
jgi:hypothetical protein